MVVLSQVRGLGGWTEVVWNVGRDKVVLRFLVGGTLDRTFADGKRDKSRMISRGLLLNTQRCYVK